MSHLDVIATQKTRNRYQRIAPFYDLMEILSERQYLPWRKRLWSSVEGQDILEVGIGTGKNIPFYPDGANIEAIDLTPGMVKRAAKRATEVGVNVKINIGDAQLLDFPDNSFDTIVATFVFCSVPDPILGLKEIKRVLKPGGHVLLLEHVRSKNAILGPIMDVFNPIVVRIMGANINRNTVENVRKAGFTIKVDEKLSSGDIFRFVIAKP
jgi:ubiquinone/menaquinone biosynthesis C-methylase UbiE